MNLPFGSFSKLGTSVSIDVEQEGFNSFYYNREKNRTICIRAFFAIRHAP